MLLFFFEETTGGDRPPELNFSLMREWVTWGHKAYKIGLGRHTAPKQSESERWGRLDTGGNTGQGERQTLRDSPAPRQQGARVDPREGADDPQAEMVNQHG